MKKSLLAVASALILGGAMTGSASAQSGDYYDRDGGYPDTRYESDDRYGDDRYDSERYYDDRYDDRNDGRRDDYRAGRQDIDGDGIDDRHDIYDNRNRVSWDRNRDGVNDRYDRDGGYDPVSDRNRDGHREGRFNDRRHAHKRYRAGRYQAPRNYRNSRYALGSRLPAGYYGSSYYVDYRPYGLSQPPRGYRWNRVGNDVYLVSINNGLIRDVIYSLFY